MAAANFSGSRRHKRAKREGRGADTRSCGAIALQRKCDTFPNHLSEDNRAAAGWGGGCLVIGGQLRIHVRIHGPSSPSHIHVIYYMCVCVCISVFPCRFPSLIHRSIYCVIAVTVYIQSIRRPYTYIYFLEVSLLLKIKDRHFIF